MEPISYEFERCIRKSKHRRNCLLMLSSLTEAYPAQLARATGIDRFLLEAIMRGALPRYSEELSLIAQGLAEERFNPRGERYYLITGRGRRKARSLAARYARRGGARFDEEPAPVAAHQDRPAGTRPLQVSPDVQ